MGRSTVDRRLIENENFNIENREPVQISTEYSVRAFGETVNRVKR